MGFLLLEEIVFKFHRDYSPSVDCFGKYYHLKSIKNSNSGTWEVFPFICFSKFSLYSWLNLLLTFFFLIYCKWNCFQIFFLYYSLLVYRNTTDFAYWFISYNFAEFISLNYMWFLGFSPYKIMSSIHRSNFISPNWISLLCFTCLTALFRIFIMLNVSGKRQASLSCFWA